jgi:hypothetical protein
MSTAKTHKRMQIWVIFLLIITIVNGCEVDTKPIVRGGNPPTIEFSGTGALAQLYVSGPYALEQLKQEYKQEYKITGEKNIPTPEQQKELERIRDNKGHSLWQLDPSRDFRVSGLSITYGIVPEGFKQVYPANGKPPEPLIEGKIYSVTPPSISANFEGAYFMINNGKAVMIPSSQITDK